MSTRTRIKVWLWIFIVGLVLSGITAFPLETELRVFAKWIDADARAPLWICYREIRRLEREVNG